MRGSRRRRPLEGALHYQYIVMKKRKNGKQVSCND
jgi:hypothetical protein